MSDFINISFTSKNVDRYIVRSAIKESLDKALPQMRGEMLDIGCGKLPYKEYVLSNSKITKYIGLDIENALEYEQGVSSDYTWDGLKMPFDDESYDSAFGTEVLEHCPDPEIVLKEVYRVLKPGGVFYLTVPFLWNLHEVPHDEYRYTPFSLRRHLENSGFSNIDIQATGGWHASMAQMLGLWIKRSPMNGGKRKLILFFIKPIMKKLIKMDKKTPISFKEGQMITGLYGVIRKNK